MTDDDDVLPSDHWKYRLEAAWAALRGRPVVYRVRFGEKRDDPRITVGPRACLVTCRYWQHSDAPPGIEPFMLSFHQTELPESEFMRTLGQFVRFSDK